MENPIDPTKIQQLLTKLQPLAVEYGVKIITALLIVVIGRWFAKRLTRVTISLMNQKKVDITLSRFLENIIYYTLLVMIFIAAAGQLGIQTTSFVAVFGAASLAVGLALKDSLSHFSSGIMLILFRPFRVGDFVGINGEMGSVEAITVFNTIINTPDNQRKIIPNGQVYNSTITNVTANPTRRVDITVGIGYDDDIAKAKDILRGIQAKNSKILSQPEPLVAVSALGASSVDFVVRSWVKTEDYWEVYFALTEQVKLRFDEEGISIPYPQQDLHLYMQGKEELLAAD